MRGAALRLTAKLREPELLEPLLPSLRQCLEYRHQYVRKNAIFAVYTIYKALDHMIPDAPELMYNLLKAEADMTCRRNAFIMLFNTEH